MTCERNGRRCRTAPDSFILPTPPSTDIAGPALSAHPQRATPVVPGHAPGVSSARSCTPAAAGVRKGLSHDLWSPAGPSLPRIVCANSYPAAAGAQRAPQLPPGALVDRAGAARVPPRSAAWASEPEPQSPQDGTRKPQGGGDFPWRGGEAVSGGTAGRRLPQAYRTRKANPSLAPGAGYGSMSWRSCQASLRLPVPLSYLSNRGVT